MSEWRQEYLGSICEILDSLRRPITKRDRISGPYPYYGATGVVDHVADFIFNEKLVLVGEDGAKWETGDSTAFIVEGKCWVNNHAHVLRPKRHIVLDEWLVYYLMHLDLSPYVGGLTVPKLNQGNLREIPVPIPPIKEQKQIVSILDESFYNISKSKINAERNIANARELRETLLSKVFRRGRHDWIEVQIGDVCTLKSGHTLPPKLESPAGDIPYLKVADMNFPGNEIEVVTSSRFVNRRDIKNSGIIPPLSTIFPKRGGAILTNKKRITRVQTWLDLNIMAVIPSSNIYPEFLWMYFESVDMKRLGSGSSIPQINNYDIAPLKIMIPKKIEEQIKVANNLIALRDQVFVLIEKYEQRLCALEELKSSFLSKAFSGQLVANEAIAA